METIAVYWESQIKTYGFNRRRGLCLAVADFDPRGAERMQVDLFQRLGAHCREILMINTCPRRDGRLRLNLLFEPVPGREEAALPDLAGAEDPGFRVIETHSPVESVIFQGPHYGDRYGIADAALQSLDSARVPVLAMTCGGSSVCLVLPDGQADLACEALSAAFVTPPEPKRKPRS